MPSNVTLERYKKAYRDMIIRREKKAFNIHAIAYAIGNSILIATIFAIRSAILMVHVSIGRMGLWSGNPLLSWSSYSSTTHCEI